MEKNKEKISLKDFSLISVIGHGSYGKVILVRFKHTKELFAMKVLKKSLILKQKQKEHTLAERKILEKISHPFVVKMKYAF
mmetsp:Transcript_21071/g.20217  ORF Transcript_21071/g.20217 Transcript_21071/m.20217 type:complete len:81 (-) Transcript_21071:423-665(-)